MKIINGERASGKTDGLIFTAYATGAQIITFCHQEADRIIERAHERGMDIITPMSIQAFMQRAQRGFRGFDNTPVIVDEANLAVHGGKSVIEIALENLFQSPVIAISMTEGQIKSVLPKKEAESKEE